MYTGFAEVYDTLMNDVHYGAWADMYARMMTAYGIPAQCEGVRVRMRHGQPDTALAAAGL